MLNKYGEESTNTFGITQRTNAEIGRLAPLRTPDTVGQELSGLGAFQRAAQNEFARSMANDESLMEAFHGNPTEEMRDRFEANRVRETAKLMMANPSNYTDEDFGAIFRTLNKKFGVLDENEMGSFMVLDNDEEGNNQVYVQNFLDFLDRMDAAETMDEKQKIAYEQSLKTKGELADWEKNEANMSQEELAAYARQMMETGEFDLTGVMKRGADYAVGVTESEQDEWLKSLSAEDHDAWAESSAIDHTEAMNRSAKDGRSIYVGTGETITGGGYENLPQKFKDLISQRDKFVEERRLIAKYKNSLSDQKLRAEGAKVIPFLSQGQRDLLNIAASGADMAPFEGVVKAMKGAETRDLMYSLIGAYRPEYRGNYFQILGKKFGQSFSGASRNIGQWWEAFGVTGKKAEELAAKQREDTAWATQVIEGKIKDPEGFWNKAFQGWADSAALQGSAFGGAMAIGYGLKAPNPYAKGAAIVTGVGMEAWGWASMCGEQYNNMLMHGVDADHAKSLALYAGTMDFIIENFDFATIANIGGAAAKISAAELQRMGLRGWWAALKGRSMKELGKATAENIGRMAEIALKEDFEELLQGMNREGWLKISLGEAEGVVDAFLNKDSIRQGLYDFADALPTCTLFGITGGIDFMGAQRASAQNNLERGLNAIAKENAKRVNGENFTAVQEADAYSQVLATMQKMVGAMVGMTKKERNTFLNNQEGMTDSERAAYAAAADYYESVNAQYGTQEALDRISGNINEAMFHRVGWKILRDGDGNVTGVKSKSGEVFKVNVIARNATLADFDEEARASFVAEYNDNIERAKALKAKGEDLTGTALDGFADLKPITVEELTEDIVSKASGFSTSKGITLFQGERRKQVGNGSIEEFLETTNDKPTREAAVRLAAKFDQSRKTGTLGHEISHQLIQQLEKAITNRQMSAEERKAAKEQLQTLKENMGEEFDEITAQRVEEIFRDMVFGYTPTKTEINRRNAVTNFFKAIGKIGSFGKYNPTFLPVVVNKEGKVKSVEDIFQGVLAMADESNRRKRELAEAKAKAMAEAKSEEERKAAEKKYEEEFAALLAEEEAAQANAQEQAQAMAEAKEREAKMLQNRKDATKNPPRLRYPNIEDSATAIRCRDSYLTMWKMKMGKPLSQEEVDRLGSEYGLPPEALNLVKGEDGKYRLSDTDLLSMDSMIRFNDALINFYRDISSVRIVVPDVVVATAEDAANAMPNEVYDPVTDTFVTGRVVINPEGAKSLREQAGLTEPSVTPAEIAEAKANHPTRFSIRGDYDTIRGYEITPNTLFGRDLPSNAQAFNYPSYHRLGVDKIRPLFYALNGSAEVSPLIDRLFSLADYLGLDYTFRPIASKDGKTNEGLSHYGFIRLNNYFFGNPFFLPQKKAVAIAHETVHGLTQYAFAQYDIDKSKLSQEQINAIEEITSIFNQVKNDPRLAGEYGVSDDVQEFLAELINPSLRNKLKTIGVYDKVVGLVAKIISFFKGKKFNALDKAESALKTLLDEFDENLFYHWKDAALKGDRANIDNDFRPRFSITSDERTTRLAPNGKRSNLTDSQYDQVRTAEFKAWFGDWENDPANASKVVDENGEPMVVYHNSHEVWSEYDGDQVWAWRDDEGPGSSRTFGDVRYDLFMNVRNPFVFDADYQDSEDIDFSEYSGSEHDSAQGIASWAAEEGYDGVIIKNIKEFHDRAEGNDYVAFSPTQIKSATDNTGAFSPTNPDIRFSIILGEKGARNLEENGQIIDNLAVAKEMLGDRWWKDLSTDEKVKIKLATGWERGADGLWRYEVPDLKYPFGQANDYLSIQEDIAIRYNETNEDLEKLNRYWAQAKAKAIEKYGDDPWMSMDKIREFLSFAYQGVKERREKTFEEIKNLQRKLKKARYPNTKLTLRDFAAGTVIEKAYPELMDTKITIKSMRGNYAGMVKNGEIFIDSDQIPYDAIRTVTHEVQHLIQKAEGFARGGNERNDGKEGYHRLAGEVEARNAEKRIGMMKAGGVAKWLERLAESGGDPSTVNTWLLEQTEDVARENQIVLHDFIFSARDYLKAVDAVKRGESLPSGQQKSANTAYPDASAEIGSVKFSIANDAKALIEKKRDDIKGKVLDDTVAEIMKFPTPKAQKAALHWFVRGTIRLPEDAPKVTEALQYAERAKGKANTDALSYPSPMAMIEALHEFKPKAKRIDPDTVPELSDKREFPMGVTTYLVQDDRAGQEAMRRIINTHWGEDANPWCLLHGDGKGNLSDGSDGGYNAARYWKQYSALPKRVAFRNGKLLAFMATDVDVDPYEFKDDFRDVVEMEYPEIVEEYDADEDKYTDFPDWMRANHKEIYREVMRDNFTPPEQWWDRQDSDHKGIPLGNMPVEGDPFGRWADFEIRDGEVRKVSQFRKLDANGNIQVEWYADGLKYFEMADGIERNWNEDGTLHSYTIWGKNRATTRYVFRDDGSLVDYNPLKSPAGSERVPYTEDEKAEAERIYRENDQSRSAINGGDTPAFSISADERAAYEEAIFNDDTETADRIVRDVAARAMPKTKIVDADGKPKIIYHRTENAFTEFDLGKARKSMDIQGLYFYGNNTAGEEYGRRSYGCFVNMVNPYVIDSAEKMNAIPFDMREDNAGVIARDWLIAMGYDGVIRTKEFMGDSADEYIALFPEQIKLAETVTYRDENGEDMIPLDERFDMRKVDIRFSLSGVENFAQKDAIYALPPEVRDLGVTRKGETKFSLATYEGGGRETLVKWMDAEIKKGNLTRKDADGIIAETDAMYDFVKKIAESGDMPSFSKWSDTTVELDEDGKPIFGVIRKNGDYVYNIDFSTVCKKRRPMDKVFKRLVDDGVLKRNNLRELTMERVVQIQDIIKKYGMEVACALCFVDSKRYRIGEAVQSFADDYNTLVREYNADPFKFAKTWGDLKKGTEHRKAEQVKSWQKENPGKELSASVRKDVEGGAQAYAKKAMLILNDENSRHEIDAADLFQSDGMGRLVKNDPKIFELFKSHEGAGKIKDSFWDVPYNNDILRHFKHRTNDKVQDFNRDKAYAVGGVRLQSFSDFVPVMLFDYIQMFAELAAKRLPLHVYTKESDFVKLFAYTGAKINMSLVPTVLFKYETNPDGSIKTDEFGHKIPMRYTKADAQAELAKPEADRREYVVENAPVIDESVPFGLGKDGEFIYADECFPVEEAMILRNQDHFGKRGNVGTIMVGISHEHIIAALRSDLVDQVIPYHSSGINSIVGTLRGIFAFTNYQGLDKTRRSDGVDSKTGKEKWVPVGKELELDWYEYLKKYGDPKKAANAYLKWCDKNGYQPRFAEFRDEENYYKLLADFRMYNAKGKYAPLEDVKMKMGEDFDEVITSALQHHEDTEAAYDRAIASGLIEEIEETVLKGVGEMRNAKKVARKSKPSKRTTNYSISNTETGNVAAYVLARGILENGGRAPEARVVKSIADSLHYHGDYARLLDDAMKKADETRKVLRYLASDPKTEKLIARAGLAERNERAIKRAREATLQFSREVEEARQNNEKAIARAVRAVRGEDYESMSNRLGLDFNAILEAIAPAEREAGEKSESKAENNPVNLTAKDIALAEELAKKAVEEGSALAAKANAEAKANPIKTDKDGKRKAAPAKSEDDSSSSNPDEEFGNAFSRAMKKAIRDAGITVDNIAGMVKLVEAITEKYIRENPAVDEAFDADDIWSSPIARAMLGANISSFAQAVAAEYAPSYARVRIAERCKALDDKSINSLAGIENLAMAIFADLNRDIVRQNRASLIKDLHKSIDNLAKHHKQNEMNQDRAVSAEVGEWLKMVRKAIDMTAAEVEERSAYLEGVLEEYGNPNNKKDVDEAMRYRDFANAYMELGVLDQFGNLKGRMPSEIREAKDFIEQTANEARFEVMMFGEKWNRVREMFADRIKDGIEGDPKNEGRKPEDAGILYSLIGMWETKARQLTRFCKDPVKRDQALAAMSRLEEMIQRAEDIHFNYVQNQKLKFIDMTKRVYGGETEAREALSHDLDKSLWTKLDRGDQHSEWTIGKALQMYVSIIQDDYADNVEAWGRGAEYRAFLENVISQDNPKHMEFIRELRAIYLEQGDAISEVLQKTCGTRLRTPNRNYMPVKMDSRKARAKKMEARAFSPFAPALTPRVKNGLDFDQDADILDVYFDRLDQTAHTIAYSETGPLVMGICQSDRVLNKIEDAFGDKVMSQWNSYILDIFAGPKSTAPGAEAKPMQTLARWTSLTWLLLNPASWAKQLAAVPCYALSAQGSLKDVAKSIGYWFKNPIAMMQIARDLAETKAFKARYGTSIAQELKYVTHDQGRLATWWQKVISAGMSGIVGMDKVGVYLLAGVYKARREALENAGKRGSEASELAANWLMHIVDKTAQTARTLNTTQLQRAGGAWNMVLQFKSSPIQQTQFELAAFQEWAATGFAMNAQGKKVASSIVINHLMVPFINAAIESLVALVTSWGEPDEEKRKKMLALLVSNVISGSLGSIVFLGCFVDGLAGVIGDAIATGERPSLQKSFRGFIPAEGAVTQWLRTGDKALKCLIEIGEKDLTDTAIEMADALAQMNWLGRTASKAIKSASEK